jgi:hypothetical protein
MEEATMRSHASRRPVARASAVLLSAAVAVGAAGCVPTPEPEATISCRYDDVAGYPVIYYDFHAQGLPPGATLSWFGLFFPANGYPTGGPRGGTVTVDRDGTATHGFAGSRHNPTADVALVLYRDVDGDSQWDPDGDDTVYRGDGTVTTCSSPTALTSK